MVEERKEEYTELWAIEEQGANIGLPQPCLHPQGRSRPQVRPEHLPSVLP